MMQMFCSLKSQPTGYLTDSGLYVAMGILIDDVGSFPLPETIDRETYNKAYRLAREALTDNQDIRKDEFIRKNFCDITIKSFKKKIAAGLDVVNSPWHYDGIRQVSEAVHKANEKGTP